MSCVWQVSNEFRSVRLPSTLMFDYPTLTALAEYVSQQLVPDAMATELPTKALARPGASASNEAIAVLGGACHLPGDSWSLEKFDFMLSQGVDCSVEMPHSRWDVDDYYDPDATTGLKMYVRHAAFIEGVELFAAAVRCSGASRNVSRRSGAILCKANTPRVIDGC